MSAYVAFGQALYDFMDALDITSVVPEGWGTKLDRPPKSDEKPVYPAFTILPSNDERVSLDNMTDDDSITYAVDISVSYWEASENETNLRALVDLVRHQLAKERRKDEPLGGSYTLSFRGEWGGDENQVERYYRLLVTARFDQDITT